MGHEKKVNDSLKYLFHSMHFNEPKWLQLQYQHWMGRELLNELLFRFHFSPAPGRMGYAAAVER